MDWSSLAGYVAYFLMLITTVLSESQLKDVKLRAKSPIVNGSTAFLDCYYEEKTTNIQSIQWYKTGEQYPVYSYADGGSLQARGSLKGRAIQKPIGPGHYRLIIKPMIVSDEGDYKCHVFESYFDHKVASAIVEVVVPPKKPIIIAPNYTLPAFTNVTIVCRGNVGKPAGRIRWWRRLKNERMYKEIHAYESRPRKVHPDKTTSVVTEFFTMVTPRDNDAIYKCTSVNSAVWDAKMMPPEVKTKLKVFWSGQIPPDVNIPTNSEAKDKKEEGFHVAGIFVLSMAGIGLVALIIICVRRHKKLQPCRCRCGCGGKKKEEDPTISTLQGAQLRVTFTDSPHDAIDSRV